MSALCQHLVNSLQGEWRNERSSDGAARRELVPHKTAWEIGCILNLSQRTVEWHIEESFKRLGAANRLQAIAMLGASLTMF